MLKNKFRFTLKLFIIVWIVLFMHVVLKLSFNYWQPYVIPTEQLQAISDFIDNSKCLKLLLNSVLYTFNGIIVILCCIKRWWFKTKKQANLTILLVILGFIYNLITKDSIINTILLSIILPLILDKSKWMFVILTFVFNNLFLLISLWLEQFASVDNMNYFIRFLFQFDYYIMLILNYFVFNLIKFKKVS